MKTHQTSKDRMALNSFIVIPVLVTLAVIYLAQKKVILSP